MSTQKNNKHNNLTEHHNMRTHDRGPNHEKAKKSGKTMTVLHVHTAQNSESINNIITFLESLGRFK